MHHMCIYAVCYSYTGCFSYFSITFSVSFSYESVFLGLIFEKSSDNLLIFRQYALILRQIYDIMTIICTLLTL